MVARGGRVSNIRQDFKQPSYQLGRWFDTLIQHRAADVREFLASRNVADPHGVWPRFGGTRRSELRYQQDHGDEGDEE